MGKTAKSSDKSHLSFLPKTSTKLPKAVESEVEAYGFILQWHEHPYDKISPL